MIYFIIFLTLLPSIKKIKFRRTFRRSFDGKSPTIETNNSTNGDKYMREGCVWGGGCWGLKIDLKY